MGGVLGGDWGPAGLEVSAVGGCPEPQLPGPLLSRLQHCYHGNQSLRAPWGGRVMVMMDVMMTPLSCSNPTHLQRTKENAMILTPELFIRPLKVSEGHKLPEPLLHRSVGYGNVLVIKRR